MRTVPTVSQAVDRSERLQVPLFEQWVKSCGFPGSVSSKAGKSASECGALDTVAAGGRENPATIGTGCVAEVGSDMEQWSYEGTRHERVGLR